MSHQYMNLLFLLFMVFTFHHISGTNLELSSKKHLPQVFWMHIQKTSSWMGNFLLLWGCKSLLPTNEEAFRRNSMLYAQITNELDQYQCEVSYITGGFGIGFHVPFNQNKIPNGTAVTLFRRPADRVISMFLHGKGIHQIMFPIGFPNRIKRKFALRKNITASEFPIFTYASLPGISGCQTKMLLGIDCGVAAELTEIHMTEAIRRLHHDVAFFGLTEESEASALLFLAMFSPVPIIGNSGIQNQINSLPETFNMLPRKNVAHTREINEQLRAALERNHWKDEFDERLYAEARKLFYDRCRYYGITTRFNYNQQ